jgi:hypothetical protein
MWATFNEKKETDLSGKRRPAQKKGGQSQPDKKGKKVNGNNGEVKTATAPATAENGDATDEKELTPEA